MSNILLLCSMIAIKIITAIIIFISIIIYHVKVINN